MFDQQLTHCPIFAGLPLNEIEELINEVHHNVQQFMKGDMLAMQGEPCNRLIILLKGSVKAEMTDPAAKIVKVEDIAAPNPLATLFLFGKNNVFPVQVTAKEDVDALIIPKLSLIKMLHNNEQVLTNYLNISAHYASMLSRKLHFLTFRTIRQKLAMYFLDLAKPDKTEIELDFTQSALSEYFGVSRPSLAREMANMQDDKLIKVNKKQVTILDRNKLIQIVSF